MKFTKHSNIMHIKPPWKTRISSKSLSDLNTSVKQNIPYNAIHSRGKSFADGQDTWKSFAVHASQMNFKTTVLTCVNK